MIEGVQPTTKSPFWVIYDDDVDFFRYLITWTVTFSCVTLVAKTASSPKVDDTSSNVLEKKII